RGHAARGDDGLVRHRGTRAAAAADRRGAGGPRAGGGRGGRRAPRRGALPLAGHGAAGDADDVAPPDRFGMARAAGPEDALRRRGPLARQRAEALVGGGAALWNMWGPAETTFGWPAARIGGGGGAPRGGPPIANTRFYVLDEDRRPVPIGVRVEVYIGGAGL